MIVVVKTVIMIRDPNVKLVTINVEIVKLMLTVVSLVQI